MCNVCDEFPIEYLKPAIYVCNKLVRLLNFMVNDIRQNLDFNFCFESFLLSMPDANAMYDVGLGFSKYFFFMFDVHMRDKLSFTELLANYYG